MKLEVGKYYVTRGGYVVHIIENPNIYFYASIESSPGVTKDGLSVRKNNTIRPLGLNKFGWTYDQYGVILGLNSEWQEKLTIVEELPCPFPEKLPEGYRWAGGFPQFRKPEKDEIYLSNSLLYVLVLRNSYSSPVNTIYSGKRFILESVPMSTTTSTEGPKDWVEITNPKHIARKDIDWYTHFSSTTWVKVSAFAGSTLESIRNLEPTGKLRCLRKDLPTTTNVVSEYPVVLKKDQKVIGTVVSTSSVGWNISNGKTYDVYDVGNTTVKIKDDAGNIQYYMKHHFGPISPRFDYRCEFTEQEALALLNPKVMSFKYWVTEPIGNMVKAAKKSVRYIVITSILSACTYTVVQPAKVVSFVKSCLPKVSIKFNS